VTLILQPDAAIGLDTYIYSGAKTSNFGTATEMGIGEDNNANNRIARSLIKFDLSSIPANATINSVTLSLWTSSSLSSNNRTIQVYRLKTAFNETQATWSLAATGTNWQTAGASGANDRESTSIGSTTILTNEVPNLEKQIVLTPAKIQEMVNGTFVNRGFIIVADTEQNDRFNYTTSDSTNSTQRPKLVIQYILATPTPTLNPTNTPTPTLSITPTFTRTATSTSTITPSLTNTPISTSTFTPLATATHTGTATVTASPSLTLTSTSTLTQTATPPTTPTGSSTPPVSPPVFSDDFESGGISAWSTSSGLVVQTGVVHNGNYAAQGNTTNVATYAKKTLPFSYNDGYSRIYFNIISYSSPVNLLGYRTSTDTSLTYLFISTTGKLSLRNDVSATTLTSATSVGNGWHALEFHVVINGASSTTEVWLDGIKVNDLSVTMNLGTNSIGRLQIGEVKTGRIYNVIFDDVIFDARRIGL
jgi:Disaggregatase related repeat